MQNYRNLNDLLSRNERAKSYFLSLPDYVQGMIAQRTSNVTTYDALRRYAENILEGDK